MTNITEDNLETVTDALLYNILLQQERQACALERFADAFDSIKYYIENGPRIVPEYEPV